MDLTGQELTKLALDRLAGGSAAELARKLRLSEVTDSQYVVKNVERWRDGKHEAPSYFVIRVLDALGAINWEKLESDAQTHEREARRKGQQLRAGDQRAALRKSRKGRQDLP